MEKSTNLEDLTPGTYSYEDKTKMNAPVKTKECYELDAKILKERLKGGKDGNAYRRV